MSADARLLAGDAALAAARWDDALEEFEAAIADADCGRARLGLAVASWWLGASQASVDHCTRAYSLFAQAGDTARAVQCAVWLCITYKANFANFAAANGWIHRADRLLAGLDRSPLHGYAWLARAYRSSDLRAAAELTEHALVLARATPDVDLELASLSQLGLIRVAMGSTAAGFTMIDEAMAAALAGEAEQLDTVVYTCCDMLNACELANDLERAAQWCRVADSFAETYGCPFLYAECRIYYGAVLAAKGRWDEAERELSAGLRITEGASSGLHARAATRLASLWIRRGRLEDADRLLSRASAAVDSEHETALSVAALLLARGDAAGAARTLEPIFRRAVGHRVYLASALELAVDVRLAAGDVATAQDAARQLLDLAGEMDDERVAAAAEAADGRAALAANDSTRAVTQLEHALATWMHAGSPFDAARTRSELARALAVAAPDQAIEHARRALADFEALGATPEADRTAAFLRALGINARTGPKGSGLLTARERQVLELLGAGLSNPEIAARLHVSRKTASHHVSNILAKLQLRNRAEAAAYAAGTDS